MQPVPAGIATRLEAELRPELKVARVKCATRLAKMRIPDAIVVLPFSTGQLEVGVIQDVEAFGSELELRPLRNLENLKERRVPFRETWAGKRVAPEGSGVAGCRLLEYAAGVVVAPLGGSIAGIPSVGPHVVGRATERSNR